MRMLLIVAFPGVAWANGPFETAGPLLDAPDAPAPIINGEDAEREDYPMSGALMVEASVGSFTGRAFVCSSTLIAPDVVLLAAHCVDEETLSLMTGGMISEADGYWWTREPDLRDYSNFTLDPPADAINIAADAVVTHQGFDLNEMQIGLAENHDIALAFLSTPVTDVPFAYLPTIDEATQLVVDLEVDVVGWGQQTDAQQPAANDVAEKQVGTTFIAELDATEMKIGEEEDDVRKCHGDSGGPTYANVTTDALDALRVIGVTSHAYDMSDCRETGGVDTRVDAYLEWIEERLTERCADGERAWCEQTGIPVLPYDVDEDGVLDWQDEKIKQGCGCDGAATGGWALAAFGALLVGARRRR